MPHPGNVNQIQSHMAKVRTARDLVARQRWKEAYDILRPLERSHPKDPEILLLLATLQAGVGNVNEARSIALRLLKIVENPDARLLLGRCERILGNTDEALAQFQRAEQTDRLRDHARILRGGALEEAARFDEAREVLEPMVREAEARGPVPVRLLLEWTKLLVQFDRSDEAAEAVDKIVAAGADPLTCHFALLLKAKALDRQGDYAGAFKAATRANGLVPVQFDPQAYAQLATALIKQSTREYLELVPRSTCTSEVPVFIAGMPRSGTSLVDRIINAHPKAAGVGELNIIEGFAMRLAREYNPSKPPPACFGKLQEREWTKFANEYVRELRRLTGPDAERVVNKTLGAFRMMSIIAHLFPKTRIIHTIRDPRDVAISCFMSTLNTRTFPWCTRLDWAACATEQSMRVMEHWKDVLDIPILDVRYEELVADPETQFRRVIEFLGLEWDDRCLDFHKHGKTLHTLSYDQVNRPVYTSSARRHRNYAPFLEGIAFPDYP